MTHTQEETMTMTITTTDAPTLDDLALMLNAAEAEITDELDANPGMLRDEILAVCDTYDLTGLPTYGRSDPACPEDGDYDEPTDTTGIYSWDMTRYLTYVTTDCADRDPRAPWRIVDRADW